MKTFRSIRYLLYAFVAGSLFAPVGGFGASFQINLSSSNSILRLGATTVPASRLVWFAGNTPTTITNVMQIEGLPVVQHVFPVTPGVSRQFYRAVLFDTNVARAPLAVGAQHGVVITTNGVIQTWGDNSAGQFGNSTVKQQAPGPTIACWEYPYIANPSTGPLPESTDTDWISVAAGDSHTLALKASGALWAWGSDAKGQLGYRASDGTFGGIYSFAVPIGTNSLWQSVFASGDNSFAIRNDGTLWAWGANNNSVLGLVTNASNVVVTPAQVGTASNWVSVTTMPHNPGAAVGIQSDGSLWAWGATDLPSYVRAGYAQSNFTVPITMSPALVNIPGPWVSAAPNPAFPGSIVLLRADGSLWVSSTNGVQLGLYGEYIAFWQNQYTNASSLYNIFIGAGATPLEASNYVYQDLIVTSYPALENVNFSNLPPILASLTDANYLQPYSSRKGWTMLGSGIALNQDGTIWTTDTNLAYYPVGPVDGVWQRINADTNWQYICGYYGGGKAAAKADGSVWGWNELSPYLLTQFPTDMQRAPVTNKWISAKITDTHAVALDTQSNLWVWGGNARGQLGMGDYLARLTPTPLPMTGPWLDYAVDDNITVAIHQGGGLWAWGNFNNTGTNAASPVQLNPGTSWRSVYAANEEQCSNVYVIAQDSTLWEIGAAGLQQLSGSNWLSVSPALNSAFALQTNGSLWAWGTNIGFGFPTNQNYTNPVSVTPGISWKSLTVGDAFGVSNAAYAKPFVTPDPTGTDGLGVRADGTLWGWGVNDALCQLGVYSNLVWEYFNCFNCVTFPCGGVGTNLQADAVAPIGLNPIVVPGQVGTNTNWRTVKYSHFGAFSVITGANDYTLGLQQNGSLWVWGRSPFASVTNQLVFLTPTNHPFPNVPYPVDSGALSGPYQVGTNTWSYVDTGVGVTTAGDLYIWGGRNQYSQLLIPPIWQPQPLTNLFCRPPPPVP